MQTLPDPSSILGLGKGAVERVDFTDHSSYGGNPWPQSQTNRFAAVFNTTLILPIDCSCTFNFYVDDVVALYIDGSMVFSSWKLQAPTSYSFTTTLKRGIHKVTKITISTPANAGITPRLHASFNPLTIIHHIIIIVCLAS